MPNLALILRIFKKLSEYFFILFLRQFGVNVDVRLAILLMFVSAQIPRRLSPGKLGEERLPTASSLLLQLHAGIEDEEEEVQRY